MHEPQGAEEAHIPHPPQLQLPQILVWKHQGDKQLKSCGSGGQVLWETISRTTFWQVWVDLTFKEDSPEN